ncbi:MAG: glycosyltransferase family 4 protein [Sulfuricurvum sp.]|uniref:glycosyltransferase family 4 protein n=1 Tax=Sulfuricurvum sp. TaxID=2025608 RepID=UPI0027352AD8|nr:glycosyltransferase family 4 protein [Sulfuricurvum sp.]MDP2850898.1 glycosyltransferase family 4 protein [Sulfuricurvum sp.]MDP3291522.1 glycosyltransferase family 4 protein [Sulfuricurvum sp.]
MKICLIVDDYLPESKKVAAKMMHELACEFLVQGHEVTVITPSEELDHSIDISLLNGITIWRFKSGKIKNVGKIQRALNETLLSHRAWRSLKPLIKQNKHDLIVYYSPSIFWGNLVYKLKKIWGVPSYLILRDFFPQWAIDQGLIRSKSFIEKYFRFFETKNYDAADTIGVMSPKNKEWFESIIQTKRPIEVLYNWAANTPVNSNSHFRESLGLQNKIVYFYGGNIGHAQDMMNIVRLAKNMCEEKKAHFVLVGAGDEVEVVKEAIDKEHLSNITLLPSVSQEVYKQMLSEFDIGLFTLHKNHTTHNFPGKLLGYMVQGIPILGSINPGNDLKPVIEGANAGLISANGEDTIFLANALKLLHNDQYRKQTGENAKKLLEQTFSVEAAASHILNSLRISKF